MPLMKLLEKILHAPPDPDLRNTTNLHERSSRSAPLINLYQRVLGAATAGDDPPRDCASSNGLRWSAWTGIEGAAVPVASAMLPDLQAGVVAGLGTTRGCVNLKKGFRLPAIA